MDMEEVMAVVAWLLWHWQCQMPAACSVFKGHAKAVTTIATMPS